MNEPGEPVDLQTDRAHGARIYDYILGGKDNYEADRAVGDASLQVWPALRVSMVENRSFMHRVGRFLAAERGIRQFLDIGTGLPTAPNLHDVVQDVDPAARVVYTDNDPIVLTHARALLVGDPAGRTAYVDADMRDPDTILNSPELRETLDLNEPLGLLVIAMMHFIADDDHALAVVRRIVDILPSGSYFAASIATDDFDPGPLAKVRQEYTNHGETLKFRTKQQAERFFEGLELEEPGIVQVHQWRPSSTGIGAVDVGTINDADIAMYGAVARKP